MAAFNASIPSREATYTVPLSTAGASTGHEPVVNRHSCSPVAASAASHFVVTKDVVRGRTFSNLQEVIGKARQEEIARMLGGKSESALQLAASLLEGRGD